MSLPLTSRPGETRPLPLVAATASLLLLGATAPRHARRKRRRRPDPELVVAGMALLACAGLTAVLVPYGLTPWAVAAWGTGAVTCLALALARPGPSHHPR